MLGEFRRLAAEPAGTGRNAPRLTDRETEILRRWPPVCRTSRSPAQLSHRTVQNHVQNTLGKLHLHNRVELVRYAIERGLVVVLLVSYS